MAELTQDQVYDILRYTKDQSWQSFRHTLTRYSSYTKEDLPVSFDRIYSLTQYFETKGYDFPRDHHSLHQLLTQYL